MANNVVYGGECEVPCLYLVAVLSHCAANSVLMCVAFCSAKFLFRLKISLLPEDGKDTTMQICMELIANLFQRCNV